MPNWFYFTLNVSGEKKDVQEFVENVKGTEKFETAFHLVPQFVMFQVYQFGIPSSSNSLCFSEDKASLKISSGCGTK